MTKPQPKPHKGDTMGHMISYTTGKGVYISDLSSMADADACDFIPQNAPAQNLFRLLRDMGKSIPEAMLEVLTRSLPASATGGETTTTEEE